MRRKLWENSPKSARCSVCYTHWPQSRILRMCTCRDSWRCQIATVRQWPLGWTHCNTTATHLQNTRNTLQHTATQKKTFYLSRQLEMPGRYGATMATRMDTLQHTCNTLATHLQHTCNTLQHTCNTLQHTATHCNTVGNVLPAATVGDATWQMARQWPPWWIPLVLEAWRRIRCTSTTFAFSSDGSPSAGPWDLQARTLCQRTGRAPRSILHTHTPVRGRQAVSALPVRKEKILTSQLYSQITR